MATKNRFGIKGSAPAAVQPSARPERRRVWPRQGLVLDPEQQPAADRIRFHEDHRRRVAERENLAGAAPDEAVAQGLVVVVIGRQARYRYEPVGAAFGQ